MSVALELTGVRFGSLVAIEKNGKRKGGCNKWRCICDCGNEVTVDVLGLRRGSTVSCGCHRRYVGATVNLTHGQSKRVSSQPSRLYRIWAGIKNRCCNQKAKDFPRYGGRGISLCLSWHSFEVFFKDMSPSYEQHIIDFGEKQTVIDRIDNDKGYSRENCRWVTHSENSRNRRNNHKLTFKGKTLTVSEWAQITGIKKVTLLRRISALGWSVEKALTTPLAKAGEKQCA